MCTHIYRPGALLSLLWLALLFNQSLAEVSNRTIDDVFGDSVTRHLPVFLPEDLGVWKDQTCGDCAINPDESHAHNGTYHSATYNPDLKSVNVTMNFDGTAIYVFLILANNAGPGITSQTDCVFKLDGTTVGTFHHVPSTRTEFQFDVLAFSKTDIPSGDHQLVIATEGLTTNSYINFDYAIYTHEENTSSTTTSSASTTTPLSSASATPSTSPPQLNTDKVPAGAIAGGIAGGIACLAAIGICLFFNHRRRRRNIKRVNLNDSDDDIPNATMNQRKPPPLPLNDSHLSLSNTINTFAATGAPSNSSPWPTQTSEIVRPSNLPSENPSPSTPHLSPYMPPSTQTAYVVSNPDHQERRQAELKKRVTLMRGELENLKANLRSQIDSTADSEVVEGTSSSSDGRTLAPPTVNVKELQAQIRMLTERVSFLQAQQSPSWTQNLAREPPPDYTMDSRDDEWTYRPANV